MKRAIRLALGGALAAALVVAASASAQAEPRRSDVVTVTISATISHRSQTAAYWTPARMRAAQPRAARTSQGWKAGAVDSGPAETVQGRQRSSSSLGGAWTRGGQVTMTTGKVFFTESGRNYVCSGSVVPADNESTVITAGHCVKSGRGAFATNFIFVPGYRNGQAPYGVWTATQLATTPQWARSGDYNYDVGFAVVGTLRGDHLSEVVGSQSIGFNQPRGNYVHAFGYPQAAPYNGSSLDYCADRPTSNVSVAGTHDLLIACNLSGGASGGPWFQGFNNSSGTGVQVSVNSLMAYTGNAMAGPYFGSTVKSVYESVQRS